MKGQLSKDEFRKALGDRLYGSGVLFLLAIDENDANDVVADAVKDDPMMKWVAGLEEDNPEKDSSVYSRVWLSFAGVIKSSNNKKLSTCLIADVIYFIFLCNLVSTNILTLC